MSITSIDNISADTKLFKTFKGMGSDGIPSFIIKGCSKIYVLLFVYIFNISLTIHIFLSLFEKSAVISIMKRRQHLRCQ